MQSNQEKYDEVIMRILNVSADDLVNDPSMMTVDAWDSMAHMELIAAVENAFDVMLDPQQIIDFVSYEKGKEILVYNGVEL